MLIWLVNCRLLYGPDVDVITLRSEHGGWCYATAMEIDNQTGSWTKLLHGQPSEYTTTAINALLEASEIEVFNQVAVTRDALPFTGTASCGGRVRRGCDGVSCDGRGSDTPSRSSLGFEVVGRECKDSSAVEETVTVLEELIVGLAKPDFAIEEAFGVPKEPDLAEEEPFGVAEEPACAVEDQVAREDESLHAMEEPLACAEEQSYPAEEPVFAVERPIYAVEEPVHVATEPTSLAWNPIWNATLPSDHFEKLETFAPPRPAKKGKKARKQHKKDVLVEAVEAESSLADIAPIECPPVKSSTFPATPSRASPVDIPSVCEIPNVEKTETLLSHCPVLPDDPASKLRISNHGSSPQGYTVVLTIVYPGRRIFDAKTYQTMVNLTENTKTAIINAANSYVDFIRQMDLAARKIEIKSGVGKAGNIDVSTLEDGRWPEYLEYFRLCTTLPELTVEVTDE